MKHPNEGAELYAHQQMRLDQQIWRTSAAIVQVTLECINYSQYIRHD